MLSIRDQQIGRVEVILYLMGVIAVIAAVAWNWNPVLLLLLIIVALPFLTCWEIHNIEHEHDLSRGIRRTMLNEGSVSPTHPSRGPVSRQTDGHDKHRVHPPNSPNDCAERAERNSP